MSSTNGIGCGGDFEGNHQEGKQVENEWHTNGEEGDAPSLRKKKQKFHIYTMEQIQILKSAFKEYSNPSVKQKDELCKILGLEKKQISNWFYNHQTHLKAKERRLENSFLRNDNDRLKEENKRLWEAIKKSICANCNNQLHEKIERLSLEEKRKC
ncbi:hypothetical protein ZOSMA_38G00890 [Zostera marina]|uniref:Homeobox domain-containing protein n=1 Tax=Zostera marina TaxID=29655 RepID=A0A0K9P710_ZOSMR|nr:hypothetical protein ZOSMA_38G00890 [Zostera marina]